MPCESWEDLFLKIKMSNFSINSKENQCALLTALKFTFSWAFKGEKTLADYLRERLEPLKHHRMFIPEQDLDS